MHDFDQYKEQITVILKKFRINHASLFGSFSKGEQNINSDIDILIEPGDNFTLFDMLKLENELEELTKRKIDLVEFIALKASIKQEVMKTAIAIL